MAIAAGSLSRPGMVNAAGGDTVLFLQIASGEVLAAFNEANFLNSIILQKDCRGGKSAAFPAFGRIPAGFHTPGNDIFEDGEANDFNHVNRPVYPDDLLVAATAVDKIDELRAYYDVRQPYTTKLGNSIASQYDRWGMQAVLRSARTNNTNSSNQVPSDMGLLGSGGYAQVTITDGASILQGFFAGRQGMNEKDVPLPDRWGPVSPYTYNLLVQNKELLNRDYGNEGNGVFYNGEVYVAAGFKLVETNHIPSTNVATNPTGARNTYTGDFTTTVTGLFHKEAIGNTWLMAPVLEIEWMFPKQCYGLVAKTSQGMGPVRFECAFELGSGASQPAL